MSTPKYWTAIEELEQDQEYLANASKEFPTDIPMEDMLSKTTDASLEVESNRRDFLKLMGFGITAATLSACVEGPVKKAIPYIAKSGELTDDIIPGVANWYASTDPMGAPILVKTREGRPIKIEGNPDSGRFRSGVSARSHASLLDLYDSERMHAPMKKGNSSDWDAVDTEIKRKLGDIVASGGSVRLVSSSVMSPSTRALIGEFLGQFADGQHITYDAISASGIAAAHGLAFNKKVFPTYHFDKAEAVVGFNCDFLGSWVSPQEYAAQYIQLRDPDKKMSRHFQFESLMTNTGAKADMRFNYNPADEGVALLNLYNKVNGILKTGRPGLNTRSYDPGANSLDAAANELVKAQGKSLLVCGSSDVSKQLIVAAINQMLGNYGNTIDLDNPSYHRQGDDAAMAQLATQLGNGEIDALIFYNANPVYDSPHAEAIKQALSGIQLSVSFANKEDETSALCQYSCPDNHYLESWGDAQQMENHYSLIQPTIYPIYNTRQVQESLMRWMDQSGSYLDYLKAYWQENIFSGEGDFAAFWNESLRKGVVSKDANPASELSPVADELLASHAPKLNTSGPGENYELVFYESIALGDGKQANNPWLQELPDPIYKVCWDNFVTVPYSDAQEAGLKNNDVVELSINGQSVRMPVVVQPGQARGTLGIALGYGRENGGKVSDKANGENGIAGLNGFAYTNAGEGGTNYTASNVSMTKTTLNYPLAFTQTYNYLYDQAKGEFMGADFDRSMKVVEETTAYEYNNGIYGDTIVKHRKEHQKHLVSLWDSYFEDPDSRRNIHWKMAIDLNKCTGCGSCVVSCNAENNIPVVGKKEMRRRRNMHWMRIDRYYSGNPDNPDVAFQPMLCQHCDNAPCETVCPVLATIHSNEGLNQMTYNRCVGTRYCANNCPYKVRRFNWFNYTNDDRFTDVNPIQSKLGRLSLNPDVTVRFRGVMEKCTFCVQRLQDAKLRAKLDADSSFAKPTDGAVQTACQQSCPTGAIVFGDFNDPKSEVYKLFREDRSYLALEEVKTLPSVAYQALVRNRTKDEMESKKAELAEVRNYDKA